MTGTQVRETQLAPMDDGHNEKYARHVGTNRTKHIYVRYLITRKHTYDFLKCKYDMEDISLHSQIVRFMMTSRSTFYCAEIEGVGL